MGTGCAPNRYSALRKYLHAKDRQVLDLVPQFKLTSKHSISLIVNARGSCVNQWQ